ncbi:hypothetical protein K7X08_000753 [Anisodus acutangulus]|uniref:Uncharacterized protein n=1 Tax=Anisodus acutangulus TaxID=402998 RepID=A0A9Q1M7J8_9SOLA|nr:hypothetical protein K7X08_000753 [Anisodus acutangulus]
MVTTSKEINEPNHETGNQSLDVKNVEVEPEQVVFETIYDNGDHSGESIKRVVVEVEVSCQSSFVLESIISSDQVLEADGVVDGQINEEVLLEGSISYGETSKMTLECSEADKQFIEELEKEFCGKSYLGTESSQETNGQIITDSGKGKLIHSQITHQK